MKISEAKLAETVFCEPEIIMDNRAKILFLGRSNVGKSSLINILLNRKNLARTSSRPGKTISINYYLVNQKFYLVDLPGYGYARISKGERQRVKSLIQLFFEKVKNVRLALMLVDSRRGFLDSDCEVLSKIIEKKFKILTVLTKTDKIKTSYLINQKNNLQKQFDLHVIPFSIKSAYDRENLLKYIEKALDPTMPKEELEE